MENKDKYKNFKELSFYEKEGEDFEIRYIFRNSGILVMAPHGGTALFLCSKLETNLKSAGFHVKAPTEKTTGTHPGNICNTKSLMKLRDAGPV